LFTTILTVIGCGRSNYFLRLDTPPALEGFLGFRWTTPADFIANRFVQYSTGSAPIPEMTTGLTPSYSDVPFLSKRASTCQLFCGPMGYYAAKLTFKTTDASSTDDIYFFRQRLSNIYGSPRPVDAYADPNTQGSNLSIYKWLDCRLELSLKTDSTIEIDAYENRSCIPPSGPHFWDIP
jgi:hypothetical protein